MTVQLLYATLGLLRKRNVLFYQSDGRQEINVYVSGPHLLLAVAMVKLAVRDLSDPRHSEEAKAFLRVEPYDGVKPEVEADLVAEILGYTGKWETNG